MKKVFRLALGVIAAGAVVLTLPQYNIEAQAYNKGSSESVEYFKGKIAVRNIKITSGENLIKDNKNIYKSDIYSNKNEVNIQIDFSEKIKAGDIVVTGTDNLIIGEVIKEDPCLIRLSLKDKENIILIKNKNTNEEISKLYINLNKVEVSGVEESIVVGDKINLYVKDNNKSYTKVKWDCGTNGVLKLNDNKEIIASNCGIGNLNGVIYDDINNIIGNVQVDFYVCYRKQLGWVRDNNNWYYIDEQTYEPKIGWFLLNGEWYCTDSTGIMQTGWISQNGKWYYLKQNGTMAISWIKDNGKWYFMDAGGEMKTGWVKDHGNLYYLNDDGSMQIGDLVINNVKYRFNSHGELQQN